LETTATHGRKPDRRVPGFVFGTSVAAFVLIYLASGVCIVKPEQQAFVKRFGELQPVPFSPGTHYRMPYPIDSVVYIKPNKVESVSVGTWTDMTKSAEGEPIQVGLGTEFLTGDENIVHITLNVQYKVGDPADYLVTSTSPESLVRLATEMALTQVVAQTQVDDLLTSGKQWVLAQVKQRAQEELDDLNAGILIIAANFAGVTPPAEVADAFKDVASALEDRDRLINEAQGHYNEGIPRARGEAERQIQEALAHKKSTINRAQGEADRFLATLKEFQQARNARLSLLRLYTETMEEVLPGMKKYIIDRGHPPDLEP
jgi:membrane protease subunit HflK